MQQGSTQDSATAPHFMNGLVKIFYEPQKSLAQIHWTGLYSSSAYREAMLACLKLNKTERVRNWVGNNVNLGKISAEDQEWSATQLFPQFDIQHFERVGLIISKDLYTKMVIETTLQKASAQSTFETQFFDDVPTAIAWIEE